MTQTFARGTASYMADMKQRPREGKGSLEPSTETLASSSWFSAPLSHSDVRFVVGQERQEVLAHRCLLACRCSNFSSDF